MTVIARLEVIPVREGSMAPSIARAINALDQYDVSYETTATDTVIEADTTGEVFAAVQAAHEAIPDDRVITSVEIDDMRGRRQHAGERVASVERALGRSPRRTRAPPQQQPAGQQTGQTGTPQQGQSQQRYRGGGSSRQLQEQAPPQTSMEPHSR